MKHLHFSLFPTPDLQILFGLILAVILAAGCCCHKAVRAYHGEVDCSNSPCDTWRQTGSYPVPEPYFPR
jgi:hypothetical protein